MVLPIGIINQLMQDVYLNFGNLFSTGSGCSKATLYIPSFSIFHRELLLEKEHFIKNPL